MPGYQSCLRATALHYAVPEISDWPHGSHSWATCVSGCPVLIVSNPILNPVQISTHHLVCYQPIFFPSSSHLTSVHLFIYLSIHTSINPLDLLSNLSTITSQPLCWRTKHSSYTLPRLYCLLRIGGCSLK